MIKKLSGTFFVLALLTSGLFAQTGDYTASLVKLSLMKEQPDSQRLNTLYLLQWEYLMNQFPEWATERGLPVGNDRWTDNSLGAIATRHLDLAEERKAILSINRDALTDAQKLNYDLLLRNVDQYIEGLKFPDELLPIDQLDGIQQGMAYTIGIQPRRTMKDYENILARLAAIGKRVNEEIVLMQEGVRRGITYPKVTMRDVPEQIMNIIPADPLASALLEPFRKFPEGVSAVDEKQLKEKAKKVFEESVRPAFKKLHDYIKDTYIPACRETTDWSSLPNGKEWYAFKVREHTTTNKSPGELYETGLKEVARIRGQMDSIRKATGFNGDLVAFFNYLRTDPKFFYKDSASLIQGYQVIAKRVDPQLVKLFGKLPRLPYGVIPVPTYAQKSQTTAYYNGGSLEAARPGYFFANTYDLPSRPKWEMEPLTLHEAVPGHHLQISLAQEMENVPELRKQSDYTAFVEGWGLYAEKLGEEMGFYETPYDKMGQLTYEMWRAVRLVVDVGLHSLGWSREKAIKYFEENAGKASHDIEVEVDRYIVWPAQALAYKTGELKIKELRAYAEKELGAKFNIRAFHDELLGAGALPLDILEKRMKTWVERNR
jgi:uncharacterized protein (DUF885 family)